jgi:DNA-binding NarL/FixJ family response regulator
MSDKRVLALTEELYDAAVGGTPWTAVGESLSRLVRARSAWLAASDPLSGKTELFYRAHFPDDEVTAYQTRFRHIDLWTMRTATAVMRAGPHATPKARISGHLVPDSEYVRSEYYAEQGRRLGLRHCLGTVVPLGSAGIMPIGLHRPDGDEPFTSAEAQLLDSLLPHLRRAMQLRHRLSPGPSSAPPGLAALDALAMAVIVVDADMRIVLVNAAAEATSSGGGALRVVREQGGARRSTLTAVHRTDQAGLSALVKATASGGSAGGAVRLRDLTLQPALAALVSPLPSRLSESTGLSGRVAGQALILLRNLRLLPAPPDHEMLRALFGLTPTEAEVACALYGGATKNAVAAARGLRESTIRTHVAAILSKTGAVNLRDLERLLANLR